MANRPLAAPLRMWGGQSESPAPEWDWVEGQLTEAGTYWVVTKSAGHPHPRPVWGVWLAGSLMLSIGSPHLASELASDARVTVHLDSGTDVVIVEGKGAIVGDAVTVALFSDTYNAKYDWEYKAERDGPPTRVAPLRVLSWQAAGAAGRGGFPLAGRWTFAD